MFFKNSRHITATNLSSKKLSGTALLLVAMATSGCASKAKGLSQSAMVGLTQVESLQQEAPAGGILAVIRYPAVVETSAKDAYYSAFEDSVIGGSSAKNGDAALRQGVADSVIVKSNYFALSLFKEMAARLPDHSVLLSPHAVKLDANGKLTSEPITQAESLPSVVSVDFATYSFPDSSRMMKAEPLTFGDLVTPLVTVRTDHRAEASTQGVLLASAPLVPYAVGTGQELAKDALTIMQNGQFDTTVPKLDFISYLNKDTSVSVPTANLRSSTGDNVVVSYPIEKITLDGVSLSQLQADNDGSIDPLERVFSDAMADRIVRIINRTDTDRAVMANKAAAIAEYDPSLAALTFVGSDQLDYQARLNYVERLLDAERKYFSVQSLRIFDGIHNGEMGVQMRDMILAEYDIIEERRRLARKQDEATAFAVLGTIAAGAAIANGGGAAGDPGTAALNRLLTQLAIQGAIYAGTEAVSLKNRSKAVGSNYLSSIVPALEQQTSVSVDLIDSSETITAIRHEDLKSKLQELYTTRQRSLDTVATRCGFDQNGGASGTWMGVCDGGKANGSGVGVVKNADGSAIEYYGYASQGLANGSGLMIFHEPNSSHSIEGNFINGLADGAMRVSRLGQSDKLRQYSAGQDVGSSSITPSSPFNVVSAR